MSQSIGEGEDLKKCQSEKVVDFLHVSKPPVELFLVFYIAYTYFCQGLYIMKK